MFTLVQFLPLSILFHRMGTFPRKRKIIMGIGGRVMTGEGLQKRVGYGVIWERKRKRERGEGENRTGKRE